MMIDTGGNHPQPSILIGQRVCGQPSTVGGLAPRIPNQTWRMICIVADVKYNMGR